MWEELLREVVVIKWGIVCMAVSLWGVTVFLLLREIPKWWKSFDKKEESTIGFKFKNNNKNE